MVRAGSVLRPTIAMISCSSSDSFGAVPARRSSGTVYVMMCPAASLSVTVMHPAWGPKASAKNRRDSRNHVERDGVPGFRPTLLWTASFARGLAAGTIGFVTAFESLGFSVGAGLSSTGDGLCLLPLPLLALVVRF